MADVYKRQAMIPHRILCTLRHTMPIPLTTEKHLPILLLPARSAAVSYTQLDVYKRELSLSEGR